MKTLKQVQNYLNEIPYINRGGCGISALAMYRWLKNNNQLTKNTEIVYLYSSKYTDSYENNSEFLNKEKGELGSCCHAGLYHRKHNVDSGGEINKYNFKESHYFTEELVVRSINNISVWNPYFERTYIGEIEEKLNINLQDIYN